MVRVNLGGLTVLGSSKLLEPVACRVGPHGVVAIGTVAAKTVGYRGPFCRGNGRQQSPFFSGSTWTWDDDVQEVMRASLATYAINPSLGLFFCHSGPRMWVSGFVEKTH